MSRVLSLLIVLSIAAQSFAQGNAGVAEGTPYINGQKPADVTVTATGLFLTIKNNLAATVAPTATDDSSGGYAVGSRWIDLVTDKGYLCLDATASSAVWTEITGGGAGDNLGDHTATQIIDASTFGIQFSAANQDIIGSAAGLVYDTLSGDSHAFHIAAAAEFTIDASTINIHGNTITNTGVLTLPTSTDTLVGRATTDTFTNKTFDANGAGNSLSNIDVADLANGTDGELITWDAAGAPATVAVGTSGQVLTSNGAGAAPTFQAASAGGAYSDAADPVVLNTTTKDVIIAGPSQAGTAKATIDGDADQIQLIVQGNATQTSDLVVFENSAGTDQFVVEVDGDTTIIGNLGVGQAPTTRTIHADSGASNNTAVLMTNNNTGNTATDGFYFGYSTNAWIWNFENTQIVFATNNGEQMRLTADGELGVNENIPDYILDVDGTIGLTETSGAAGNIASKGQIWVKNTASNELWFTDDDGEDHRITFRNETDTTTLGAAATTFAADARIEILTGDAGTNTIATITGAFAGQHLTCIFTDGNITITDDNTHAADTVDLSAAFTSADDTTLTLCYDGTSWYEISRSTN